MGQRRPGPACLVGPLWPRRNRGFPKGGTNRLICGASGHELIRLRPAQANKCRHSRGWALRRRAVPGPLPGTLGRHPTGPVPGPSGPERQAAAGLGRPRRDASSSAPASPSKTTATPAPTAMSGAPTSSSRGRWAVPVSPSQATNSSSSPTPPPDRRSTPPSSDSCTRAGSRGQVVAQTASTKWPTCSSGRRRARSASLIMPTRRWLSMTGSRRILCSSMARRTWSVSA